MDDKQESFRKAVAEAEVYNRIGGLDDATLRDMCLAGKFAAEFKEELMPYIKEGESNE